MAASASNSFVSPLQARSTNGAPVQISRFCIVHMASTFAVVGVGSAVMMMRKGTRQHRILGRVWSGAMVTACLSSYGIRNRNQGGFSWLHGLSTLTLGSVGAGIYYIKNKKVAKHMKCMRMSFFGALGTGFLAVSQVDRVVYKKLFS
ncbi:hypothetical protein Poli38472_012512 [Pythium oligandrum]|uniref:Transmembrane protein n=1 Tax=Pythium oligandrum TaxID=41045 RepID=A0A8K1FG70_PYTOL|nr:hypothetical protein Poli38472_012512 [Pythium oligandrum]|eukprot:TMW61321.1 hypothetical protein Poli38472_012512 [Pythium oligandrum]